MTVSKVGALLALLWPMVVVSQAARTVRAAEAGRAAEGADDSGTGRSAGTPRDPLEVLFIGNSYTAFNNLPAMLEELAGTSDGRTIRAVRHTFGGCTLKRHVEEKDAIGRIRSGDWDVVVLQEQSLMPVVGRPLMHEYARRLHAEIERLGARTVFYLTWARREIPAMQDGADPNESVEYARAMYRISHAAKHVDFDTWRQQHQRGLAGGLSGAYFDIAAELKADVAPVGVAWRMTREAHPQLTLHASDGSHPTPAGTYLTACVFYGVLLGKSPEGLPGRIEHNGRVLVDLPASRAGQLQQIAWRAVRESADRVTQSPKSKPVNRSGAAGTTGATAE